MLKISIPSYTRVRSSWFICKMCAKPYSFVFARTWLYETACYCESCFSSQINSMWAYTQSLKVSESTGCVICKPDSGSNCECDNCWSKRMEKNISFPMWVNAPGETARERWLSLVG